MKSVVKWIKRGNNMLASYEQYYLLNAAALGIGILNISLVLALLYLYNQTYKEIKSKFTLGLMVFAFLLFLQNFVSGLFLAIQLFYPLNLMVQQIYLPILPLSFINIVQLVALSILFIITRK